MESGARVQGSKGSRVARSKGANVQGYKKIYVSNPLSHIPYPTARIPHLISQISHLFWRNTQYATRSQNPASQISPPKSKIQNLKSKIPLDTLIGLLLFLTGLYAYTATLAPTVLEGDAALFQYTPYVLGVTYPTGYPLYILLGKLWISLLPFGEIAWRMNLFSAICSALALPLIYGATRRLYTMSAKSPTSQIPFRAAAVATVLIFATLPTFWRWSTEAKIYALNILLFSGVLYTLALAVTIDRTPITLAESSRTLLTNRQSFRLALADWYKRWPLVLPTLLLGLQISVHSTTILLVPGLLLFIWFNLKKYLFTWKLFFIHCSLLIIPGLLYLYVPLRAEWLIAQYTRPNAIAQGLLADFYTSGPAGLVRYFTAADFTGGVVSNWGLVPQQFFSVYIPLLTLDTTTIGAILALVGGIALAVAKPRFFVPLFLVYLLPIPFVLTYGQGEQSAFLLPSFLIVCVFAGYSLVFVTRLCVGLVGRVSTSDSRASKLTAQLLPLLLLLGLVPLLLQSQVQHNVTWLTVKWNRDIYNEWADALNHPLEENAGMLAHWGDLTSFWYLQHTEGRRPDLHGVYPPTEEAVVNWFEQGNPNLYIAGPLQGWAAGIENRYQLVPWGRLIRIASKDLPPQNLLPGMSNSQDVTFDNALRLLGADFASQAVSGQEYPVAFTWQALEELPPQTTVSLRLVDDNGVAAQIDDPLRSGWFPRESLPAGQYGLSYPLMQVPLGTLPGQYRLQLVAYQNYKQPWIMPNGSTTLDLGPVEIVSPPANYQPNTTDYRTPPAHTFNNQIKLIGYNYNANRVGQGKGLRVDLLWQAVNAPQDNYTLLLEAVDASGNVLQTGEFLPVGGQLPTGSWQPGQFIKDQIAFIVPAGASPGEDALRVRLSWLRPDGSRLALYRWVFPFGDGLDLNGVEVTEKEDRTFTVPEIPHPVNANFENKALLLGYEISGVEHVDTSETFTISRQDCATGEAESCKINLNFYWQGISEMAEAYQVFLHVVNENGQIVAQHDQAPGIRGKQPTTGWLPGEVVLDPVEISLPQGIATGSYRILVGMYQPPEGSRLLMLDNAGQTTTDFVDVGTIEVMPQ